MGKSDKVRMAKHGNVTVLNIRCDVTERTAAPIREVYDQLDSKKERKLLLHFAEEVYINSEGLKGIIQLLAQARERRQEIAFTGLSYHLKKIFSMVGITKFAQIFDTQAEAVKAFESTGKEVF